MDVLLFRSLKGDTSASEEEVVLAWRRAAPENESSFEELARLLELTADVDAEQATRPRPVAAELIALAEAGEASSVGPGRTPSWRARRRAWLPAVVGAAVAAAVAVVIARPGAGPRADDPLGFGVREFATGATEAATVHLRDGTVVRLAPRSRLRLTGAPGEREVTLEGRAYFAVAKMPDLPFTVKSNGGEAVVLGTRFEADASGEELRLLVVEGSVALGLAGNQVRLKAGEMARSVEGAVSAPVKVEDIPPMLEWLGDFLVFQETPIPQVATELAQHFNVRVEVVGEDPERQTVTAWFGDSSIQDVLRVVCRVLAAECTIDGARVRIDLNPAVSPPGRITL
jgi:ferric-dicitrate binding protein FerR (iron transport regulator)